MGWIEILKVTIDTMTLKTITSDLETFQGEIDGGSVECVTLPNGNGCMYFDEHGKAKHLPPNRYATILAVNLGWVPPRVRTRIGVLPDVLIGDVLFLGRSGSKEADVPQSVITTAYRLGMIV